MPRRKYYGVMCPRCESVLWYASQLEAQLKLDISFTDKGVELIDTPLGIAIGLGRFPHVCRIEDDYLKER